MRTCADYRVKVSQLTPVKQPTAIKCVYWSRITTTSTVISSLIPFAGVSSPEPQSRTGLSNRSPLFRIAYKLSIFCCPGLIYRRHQDPVTLSACQYCNVSVFRTCLRSSVHVHAAYWSSIGARAVICTRYRTKCVNTCTGTRE